LVCNLSGHYAAGMHVDFWVTPKGATPVTVDLGDTSSTSMFIHLSQDYAPQGPVTFIITNTSTTMKHELVGFATKTMAADYPITGFEGDPNKIDEDKAGTSVIDTGAALAPGATQMLTVDMASGHYALVCNLSGHYAAGMHVDFWATPVA
ncbi:MAG: sulfocyanin-like copper-binding protein, partial [Acidimicrobiia bacterium]